MDWSGVPFAAALGVEPDGAGGLLMRPKDSVGNHLGTVHAGALFTLAESASAECLLQSFPELAESVVPVLRAAKTRYRRAATTTVRAVGNVRDEDRAVLRNQLERKGRAVVTVEMEVRGTESNLVCTGSFEWYIQAQA